MFLAVEPIILPRAQFGPQNIASKFIEVLAQHCKLEPWFQASGERSGYHVLRRCRYGPGRTSAQPGCTGSQHTPPLIYSSWWRSRQGFDGLEDRVFPLGK